MKFQKVDALDLPDPPCRRWQGFGGGGTNEGRKTATLILIEEGKGEEKSRMENSTGSETG